MWKWETEHDAKGVVVIVHNILEHTGRYAYVITMLRRNGYHVIMGDLPGQGQTSRANKGQLEHFDIYHETLIEWVRIANEYKIPTFVMCVGLGGLILLNVLEKTELPIEGMLLLSPLLEFKRNNKTRKNMLISNVGKGSKDARFKLGIETKDLTRNDEVIEETKQDGLMLRKVTYKWYNILLETMKDTVQHFKDIQSMPTLLMYGTEDKLLELRSFNELKNNLNTNEFYFKVWEGFYHEIHNEPERDQVMRYVLTFLNNSVNTMGFIVNEEEIEEV
ncbi:alpha/beta fold hydrolase [Staphylococcus haemolyticus]|uniref:alpha/beta fold hydrolase n=1 Tax=Staphylococcus haemolyticus TaxID=1283 RepID=UPI001F5778EE|nr:alpha/beta hydrolase [Staphylococcus haemolyticus]MCI2930316.1 alpha/beta hydrolase [Staphylococcus haemolyticus]MCI2937183.1 alpha/beta hydrolase [Staphylococcus haemolyticus]MCI2939436.1 alpha/beta hydrolase [Staphylococcus haemolyticus]